MSNQLLDADHAALLALAEIRQRVDGTEETARAVVKVATAFGARGQYEIVAQLLRRAGLDEELVHATTEKIAGTHGHDQGMVFEAMYGGVPTEEPRR